MKKHIVVVDDDPGILDALQLVFDKDAYAITVMNNAYPIVRNAIRFADLYILDKQLSGIDGVEVCRYLKTHLASKHIPVMLLSAAPDISHWAKDCGADAAIEKPFKLAHLREVVERLLKRGKKGKA